MKEYFLLIEKNGISIGKHSPVFHNKMLCHGCVIKPGLNVVPKNATDRVYYVFKDSKLSFYMSHLFSSKFSQIARVQICGSFENCDGLLKTNAINVLWIRSAKEVLNAMKYNIDSKKCFAISTNLDVGLGKTLIKKKYTTHTAEGVLWISHAKKLFSMPVFVLMIQPQKWTLPLIDNVVVERVMTLSQFIVEHNLMQTMATHYPEGMQYIPNHITAFNGLLLKKCISNYQFWNVQPLLYHVS